MLPPETTRMSVTAATGRLAEELAVRFLEERGFRVLARNWRRPQGELDLVADHGGVCVFVEVRSRTGVDHGHPLETVTPRKRAQIARAARLYLHEEAPAARAYRFDVVGVIFAEDARTHHCVHVEDAFRLGG
jgi:putative endonuclease